MDDWFLKKKVVKIEVIKAKGEPFKEKKNFPTLIIPIAPSLSYIEPRFSASLKKKKNEQMICS